LITSSSDPQGAVTPTTKMAVVDRIDRSNDDRIDRTTTTVRLRQYDYDSTTKCFHLEAVKASKWKQFPCGDSPCSLMTVPLAGDLDDASSRWNYTQVPGGTTSTASSRWNYIYLDSAHWLHRSITIDSYLSYVLTLLPFLPLLFTGTVPRWHLAY
jgi:hypothetical protein